MHEPDPAGRGLRQPGGGKTQPLHPIFWDLRLKSKYEYDFLDISSLAQTQRAQLDLTQGSHAHPHQKGGDFACGDDRAMAHPLLLSMQNVWLKEHNRIAGGIRDALAKRKGAFGRDPRRDDEFIYQVMYRARGQDGPHEIERN